MLNRYTEKELECIVQGIILQYDWINLIDKEYDLSCKVYILKNDMINFTVKWCCGHYEHNDEQYKVLTSEFKIHKDVKLKKLVKELNNIIDEVVSKPYNTKIQDFDFKDEY
jgi:hypothetical protein